MGPAPGGARPARPLAAGLKRQPRWQVALGQPHWPPTLNFTSSPALALPPVLRMGWPCDTGLTRCLSSGEGKVT